MSVLKTLYFCKAFARRDVSFRCTYANPSNFSTFLHKKSGPPMRVA